MSYTIYIHTGVRWLPVLSGYFACSTCLWNHIPDCCHSTTSRTTCLPLRRVPLHLIAAILPLPELCLPFDFVVVDNLLVYLPDCLPPPAPHIVACRHQLYCEPHTFTVGTGYNLPTAKNNTAPPALPYACLPIPWPATTHPHTHQPTPRRAGRKEVNSYWYEGRTSGWCWWC